MKTGTTGVTSVSSTSLSTSTNTTTIAASTSAESAIASTTATTALPESSSAESTAAISTSPAAANAASSNAADLSTDVVTETTTIMTTDVLPTTMTSEGVFTSTAPDGAVVTYTSVITVTGQTTVITAIATVDPSGGNSLNNAAAQDGDGTFFNNTGAVAGTFTAVALAAIAMILGGLWFMRRRRRQRALDEDLRVAAGGAGDGGAGTSRFHDDEDDEDFDASTNAHGSYPSPPMTQYSPFGLPPGAAASSAGNTQSYYGTTGPTSTESGYGPALAGGALAGGAMAAGYASHNNGGYSQYAYGPSQAYNDQYAMAQQYTDNPYGDWNEVSQPMMAHDGSGEGSGDSDPSSNRRDSK